MSRLILHTGAHKTGTTSLQHSLALNRDLLARHGVVYPHVGPNMGHHALTALWCDRSATLPKGFFRDKGPGQMLADIVAAHAASKRTVVLSSEAFSLGGRKAVDMADLRRRVAAFERAGIVHVLREQCGFMQSVYLELTRHVAMGPFAAFLESGLHNGRVAGLWCVHQRLYERLRAGFEPAEITFADYDLQRQNDGGLLGFFLQHAGAGAAAQKFAVLERNRNVSPEPLALWLAQQVVGARVPGPGVIDVARACLKDIFGPQCRSTLYTRSEVAAVKAHFAPLNAAFAQRIAAVQPGFAMAAPQMPSQRIHREDITPDVLRRFRARLEHRRALYRATQAPAVRGRCGPATSDAEGVPAGTARRRVRGGR